MPDPRTYNDALISEKSRAVFYKALDKIDAVLDGTAEATSERLHALAACADAAASGFSEEDKADDDGY
jgi:hypothetical protein